MCFICRPPGQRTLSDDFVINFKQNLLVFLFKKRSNDRYLAHCEIKAYLPKSFLKRLIIARKGARITLSIFLKKLSPFCLTVTVQLASTPFEAVAVMVAVPSATAVTTPFSSTVATEVFDELQVTDLSVALLGLTVVERLLALIKFDARDLNRLKLAYGTRFLRSAL